MTMYLVHLAVAIFLEFANNPPPVPKIVYVQSDDRFAKPIAGREQLIVNLEPNGDISVRGIDAITDKELAAKIKKYLFENQTQRKVAIRINVMQSKKNNNCHNQIDYQSR